VDSGTLFILAVAGALLVGAVVTRRSSWTAKARHVALTAWPDAVRRGDSVSVRVAVERTVPALEVGLVCREHYDALKTVHTADGRSKVRETSVADAYADWRPAQAIPGTEDVAFVVPLDAPYSYEGDAVSYAWRVSVRGGRRTLDVPIWVEA
jgi:hypothetical protein